MEGLRDIKDIVEVNEYSFELLILTIFITIITIAFFLYLYKNRKRRKKRATKKELALKRLKNIDFDDVKNTAYTFSVDGYLWVNDQNREKFKKIENNLAKYKYQKDVPESIDNETKKMIKEFIKDLR